MGFPRSIFNLRKKCCRDERVDRNGDVEKKPTQACRHQSGKEANKKKKRRLLINRDKA
jgi:hypothetical protein